VAGAHVNLTSYVDIDGNPVEISYEAQTGELWTQSSCGPTRDGRPHGIVVTAAGHNAFAAYAPNSYWTTFRHNLIQDGGGWYGRAGATSGSAPIVVGAVALLLDVNPLLTAGQVRQILRESATTDSYTGQTPNLCWGYGKLNIERALELAHTVAIEVPIDIKPASTRNHVNPKSRGRIRVAILSTPQLDALTILERTSLTFGRTGDEDSLIRCKTRGRDVNHDGLRDLICDFSIPAAGFQKGNSVGILKGMTVDGASIFGQDFVRVGNASDD
jgi:hypothetical protein